MSVSYPWQFVHFSVDFFCFLGKVSKVLINNDKNYESLVKNLKGKGNRGLFVGNSLKIGTVMSSRVIFVQKYRFL